MFLKVGRGNISVGHEDSELMNQYMIAFIALPFEYIICSIYCSVSNHGGAYDFFENQSGAWDKKG